MIEGKNRERDTYVEGGIQGEMGRGIEQGIERRHRGGMEDGEGMEGWKGGG